MANLSIMIKSSSMQIPSVIAKNYLYIIMAWLFIQEGERGDIFTVCKTLEFGAVLHNASWL